jgi:SAM-dependent methyltransferase
VATDETGFHDYWQRKTDSDHVPREGYDVFRIGAGEIQPFLHGRRSVLELGCGAGELFEHLDVDRSAYLGVDFSRSMLDTFKARHAGVRLEHGEASTFTTKEKFDFVLVNNVVQYCAPYRTLGILQNAADMLAPGGRIFLGNIPDRRARLAYRRGYFFGDRAGFLVRLGRFLRAVLFILGNRTDTVGYWYTPDEIARFAKPLGLEVAIFGCVLYPYRFSAVLERAAP